MITLIDGTFLVIMIMAVINVREHINDHVEINSSYWWSIVVISGCLIEIVSVSHFFYTKSNLQLDQE